MLIYKIESLIDGKVYIGQTTTSNSSLDKRIYAYRGDVKKYSKGNYPHKSKIIRALAKYGFENFSFMVIDKADNQEQLDIQEKFWISHYDSTNRSKGFNIQHGGWGVGKHSEETKKIMSKKKIGTTPYNKGKTGLLAGEKIGTAKLTQQDADEIRNKRKNGVSVRVLQAEYGVSKPTILSIVNNVRYINKNEAKVIPPWFVYILRSLKDNSLYTGIALNIERRLQKHNGNHGARYTRGRAPFVLVFSEKYETKSEALKREYAIKQLTKNDKEKMIEEAGL